MAKKYAASKLFKRIAKLNAMIDGDCPHDKQGARKAKKALSDKWFNRSSGNVSGFFDQKKARAMKREGVCVVS